MLYWILIILRKNWKWYLLLISWEKTIRLFQRFGVFGWTLALTIVFRVAVVFTGPYILYHKYKFSVFLESYVVYWVQHFYMTFICSLCNSVYPNVQARLSLYFLTNSTMFNKGGEKKISVLLSKNLLSYEITNWMRLN